MEVLFWHHPHESIRFFRDMYAMSFCWGICIVLPTIFYLSETWIMTGYCYHSLRTYHFLRLFIFIIQVPLRFKMLMRLREAGRLGQRELVVAKLMELCRSRLWTINQALAYFVHGLFLAAVIFVLCADCRREAPILYYLCVLNLVVFVFNMFVSYAWLTHILGPLDMGEHPTPPATTSDIEKYTVLKEYKAESGESTSDLRCPICYEDYKEEVIVRVLPCSHSFHKGCIDLWLQKKSSCPYCLHSISVPIQPKPSQNSTSNRNTENSENSETQKQETEEKKENDSSVQNPNETPQEEQLPTKSDENESDSNQLRLELRNRHATFGDILT